MGPAVVEIYADIHTVKVAVAITFRSDNMLSFAKRVPFYIYYRNEAWDSAFQSAAAATPDAIESNVVFERPDIDYKVADITVQSNAALRFDIDDTFNLERHLKEADKLDKPSESQPLSSDGPHLQNGPESAGALQVQVDEAYVFDVVKDASVLATLRTSLHYPYKWDARKNIIRTLPNLWNRHVEKRPGTSGVNVFLWGPANENATRASQKQVAALFVLPNDGFDKQEAFLRRVPFYLYCSLERWKHRLTKMKPSVQPTLAPLKTDFISFQISSGSPSSPEKEPNISEEKVYNTLVAEYYFANVRPNAELQLSCGMSIEECTYVDKAFEGDNAVALSKMKRRVASKPMNAVSCLTLILEHHMPVMTRRP